MRLLFIFMLSAYTSFLFGQTIPKKFEDGQWAHFNANINIFMNDGIGNAFKRDLDAFYVDDKLKIKHYVFHNLDGMLMESFSYIDFNNEENQDLYQMNFENGETASFAQVMEYIADNYTGYYIDKSLRTTLYKQQVDSIKNEFGIRESKRFVFQEYWYYDKEYGEMKSYLRGVGLAPKESKDFNYVLWMDMRYFDTEVLKRIKVMEGDSLQGNFIQYLQSHPFAIEKLERGYSRFFDQTFYDPFNNEVDAYFELFMQRNQMKLDRNRMKTKKGLSRSKMMSGVLKKGKLDGVWKLNYPSGKIRSEFTFKDGIAEGGYKIYDEKGNLMEAGSMTKNLKHLKCESFYPNKVLKSSKEYHRGIPTGTHQLYFDNGKTHSKFSFTNGLVDGDFVQYNEDESVYLQGNFVKGIIEGIWKYNLPINSLMCGYMVDLIPTLGGEVNGLDPTCMEDCKATFEYKFVHDYQKYCMDGLCIRPQRHSDIK